MLGGGVWNQQLCGSLLKHTSEVIQANKCEASFWHVTLYEHSASIKSKQEPTKLQHDTFVKKVCIASPYLVYVTYLEHN